MTKEPNRRRAKPPGGFTPIAGKFFDTSHWRHPMSSGEVACKAFAWFDLFRMAKWADAENRWLAQRYGCTGKLVDFGLGQQVPFADLIDEILDLVGEHARELDCVEEVERARDISKDRSSES